MSASYLKLFVDCLEKYRKLNDTEFGRLIRAALRYKANGEEVKLTGREELLWDGIKLDIDRDNKKYDAVSEARAEAGRKGAESRWQKPFNNSNCHLPNDKNGQEEDKDKDKEIIAHKPKRETIDNFFESVWKLYPCKKGKAQIKDATKRRLFDIGYDVLALCINRYMNDKPDWQDYQHGSTFFNGGYVDYLDENYSKPQDERRILTYDG